MTIIAPHNSSDTSREAAAKVSSRSATDREITYNYIKSKGIHGSTINECHRATGIKESSLCGRFSELQGKVYGVDDDVRQWPTRIVKSDERRKTDSGCSAQVWIAV